MGKALTNPLVQMCTEDKVHTSFDIGEGEVLCIEITKGKKRKVDCSIEKLEDYAFILASTPWVNKANALAWNF